jgi:glycine hydroxymethyltransferase
MGKDFENHWFNHSKGEIRMMSSLLDLLFSRNQGGPCILLQQRVAFGEALKDEFLRMLCNYKKMQMQWLMLCKRGYEIIFGGTDNHMMLIDLRNKNISGKELRMLL